jgi:hypothetical protein
MLKKLVYKKNPIQWFGANCYFEFKFHSYTKRKGNHTGAFLQCQ